MEKKNKSGFTLIELLIVIAIIAILAAIIIASTGG
ncbi:MAG TPA: prepilin-type N-terminal cleavage/methylation domain-containing protein, partial [Candidatus Pacearchaeota archaeon]|nr:prepilin-type N-terminal cleavage/methylation domain-containing protein [Candidatus Pacearchaeota archaeon]